MSKASRIGRLAAARLGAFSFDQRMATGLFALMALLPVAISALGGGYLLSLGERVMIFAIAALSLELLIGVAGLVSFGQMAFFVATSLAPYGGDDGLSWPTRTLVFGTRALKNEAVFYYAALACLVVTYVLAGR